LESFAEEMAAAGLRITHQEVRWGEIWAVCAGERGSKGAGEPRSRGARVQGGKGAGEQR
jgi:hypothetical protein